MKNKLNNKGYMLIEIILASALAFGLAYFIIDLTIKLKNKNDDLLVTTQITTDTTVVSNKLMSYIKKENISFDCNNIKVDEKNNSISYNERLITQINKYANIEESDPNKICSFSKDYVNINIPISIPQIPDKNFDINIYYEFTKRRQITCEDIIGSFEYDKKYDLIDDGNGNCRIKFYESGTLKLDGDFKTDIFVVGGGGGGCSGNGGGGGYTRTYKNIELAASEYSIHIGNGGASCKSGEKSWFEDSEIYYANGGGTSSSKGGNGGSGGGGSHNPDGAQYGNIWGGSGGAYGSGGGEGYGYTPYGVVSIPGNSGGSGQGKTTCEFGLGTTSRCNSGISVYAGGGGGQKKAYNQFFSYTSGLGGVGGGGDAGSPGEKNTGGGGGASTSGGSGIIIIRNAR